MALFNFGKKKDEEKKTPACACNCGCSANEAESITNDCCPDLKEGEDVYKRQLLLYHPVGIFPLTKG